MTVGSGAPCVKATSRSSTATHRRRKTPRHPEALAAQRRASKDGRESWPMLRDAPSQALRMTGGCGWSMPGTLLHRGELLGTGGALVRCLPGLVRHAVDGLAA